MTDKMKKEIELYEIIYLLNPGFTQQEVSSKVDYYQTFLTKQGSQVMVQNRGKRSLSYPIKGFENANYIQMVYLGNGKLVEALNKEIKRDASILRNITTRLPEEVKFA
jgi:small subunit ribosomal protein S6